MDNMVRGLVFLLQVFWVFLIRIILRMLYNHHLHVVFTGTTNGRNLGTFKNPGPLDRKIPSNFLL
jgi:hypothetical protein